ncbi:MAG: MFS transporter, partial [Ktedonobacteraceae bacterium]
FVPGSQVGNANQATLLGWLAMIASTVSLFMPPLVGHLSDRTAGPFGRRRPYIFVGGLLQVGSAFYLALADTMLLFLVGLTLLHIGNNILTPAYQSLVPDQVSEEQRGAASGYVGAMTILGNVASLALAAWLLGGVNKHAPDLELIRSGVRVFYSITALVMVLCLLITLLNVREFPWLAASKTPAREQAGLKQRFKQDWLAPWRNYNFTLVFFTRAFIMLGLAMFMTFVEYYFARVQHISNFVQVTAVVAVLALGGGVVSGIVSGIFSDRLPRRAPLVCAATICMSLASLAFVVFPSTLAVWLWPLGILFGLGYGAYMSVDWALSIDVLPSLNEAGKDLGLWGASANIPALIAPLLGSLIINLAARLGQIELGYRL